MLATASGRLPCKGLPLPPAAGSGVLAGKENRQHEEVHPNRASSVLADAGKPAKNQDLAALGAQVSDARVSVSSSLPGVVDNKEERERAEFERRVQSDPNRASSVLVDAGKPAKNQDLAALGVQVSDARVSVSSSLPGMVDNKEERERAEFERRVQSDEDVVAAWCEYVQWAADRFQDRSEELTLLARACCALGGDPRHRHDVRHLRLWVRHAGHLPEPQKVFDFLEAQGIGECHALRYEAKAAALERQHCFEAAAAQYLLGLEKFAEPIDRLEKRLCEFRDRMRKRAARGERQKLQKLQSQPGASPSPLTPQVEVAEVCAAEERRGQWEDAAQAVTQQKLASPQGRCLEEAFEDVSVEELQARRVLVPACTAGERPSESLRHRSSLASNMTQELTTSGVRALLSDERLSHAGSRGSISDPFEDPTCTMELAKREVLELLAHDPDHEPGKTRRDSLKPLVRIGARSGGSGLGSSADAPAPAAAPLARGFEIFEEDDLG